MALAFVGLGVQGLEGLPQGALKYLRACEEVYADVYTSPWPPGQLEELGRLLGGNLRKATRVTLEDGRKVLEGAATGDVAVACVGDPFIATTHQDLRLRAMKAHIPVKIFYASSAVNVVFGETGLHPYKLGRVITLIRAEPSALASVYAAVKEALNLGLHSVILLEYSYDEGFDLTPSQGLRMLQDVEKSYRLGVFADDRLIVVASRVGWPDQSVRCGRLVDLVELDFGPAPHCILVPGPLHYTEEEALGLLLHVDAKAISSARTTLAAPSKTIVDRTVAKTRAALVKARELAAKAPSSGLDDVFENVEAYLSDAERFILEGKPELALIEAGYAEGLLDSLRLQGRLDLDW